MIKVVFLLVTLVVMIVVIAMVVSVVCINNSNTMIFSWLFLFVFIHFWGSVCFTSMQHRKCYINKFFTYLNYSHRQVFFNSLLFVQLFIGLNYDFLYCIVLFLVTENS